MSEQPKTHTLRVTLTYVGGRTETVDTYVSGVSGQVAIIESAVRGRIPGYTGGVTVHGIEASLWTATVRAGTVLLAVACGTAPIALRPGEKVDHVWPSKREDGEAGQ
jgi:hypothetical protein